MKRWIPAIAALFVLAPVAATAKTTVTLDGASVYFFADVLALAARGGAELRFSDGTVANGDAAYLDLRTDRAVVAGHVRVRHRRETLAADVVGFDLESERVDVLALASGASRTTRALGTVTDEPIEAATFTFPDVADNRAYIRSRHADVVAKTSVRFRPAAFPTSIGAPPVPSYLYTYATSSGFAATSLAGSTFDQPYGLVSLPNSATALHARYTSGIGPSIALQEQLIDGDNAFVAASIDVPVHATNARAVNAYRRLGQSATVSFDAFASDGVAIAHSGFTDAIGALASRLDYTRTNAGFSSLVASVRTPARPLFAGATWSLSADFGYDAQRGGLLALLPDDASYGTLWHHRLDGFVASPVVHGPLGTSVAATADLGRTWYSFPHHVDALQTTLSVSRKITKSITVFAGYIANWAADVYPGHQTIFYQPIAVMLPDGRFWTGYTAFNGSTTNRGANLDVQYIPNPSTSVRVSYRTTNDFPQFDGFGRPVHELRADVRLRPAPNFGIAFGRSYDFGWAGAHFVPGWTFSVTP